MKTETRKMQIEKLEDRWNPAGNVLAATLATGGVLVTGDAAANQVEAFQNVDGDLVVRGLSGTTINGAAVDVIFTKPLPYLAIALNAGNDVLNLHDVETTGDLLKGKGLVVIDAGAGADIVTATHIDASYFLVSGGGVGPLVTDTLLLTDIDVRGEYGVFWAYASRGNVTIEDSHAGVMQVLGGIGPLNLSIARTSLSHSLLVLCGRGNDSVFLDDVSATDAILLVGGGGTDTLTSRGSATAFFYDREFELRFIS